jgi:hypothetical protein
MVEQDWTSSTITPSHLQKVVKHGFMSAVELVACWVPEDPAFPTPTEGYMVSFTDFYEWGFGMPPHQFLLSLLRYDGLELQHLTPLGVLLIVAFVTVCEAYLGTDPDLDPWKYIFHVPRPQDSEVELMISGGAVIHVKLGHIIDPYLEIPMPRSMKGWRKKWFYLENDDSAPLPVFTGGHPVPQPSWREGAAGKDINKIQPLREYLQLLRQEGLTGIHLLHTSFSRRIQPLRRHRTKMWRI